MIFDWKIRFRFSPITFKVNLLIKSISKIKIFHWFIHMKFLLALVLFLISSSVAQFSKDEHHILVSVVAQDLCSSIFISKRNYSLTPPYLEDISDAPGYYATMKVNHIQQFVMATSISFPEIRKISKYIDSYRGCSILREPVDFLDVNLNPLERRKHNFKPLNIQSKQNSNVQKIIEAEFSNAPIRTRSIIVYHKNKIIGEKYTKEFTKDTPQLVWSVTKSFLNVFFGMAVHKKKLSIEDLILAPEWKFGDPRNAMKIKDALRMTSTLDFSESYGYRSDPAKITYNSTSMGEYAALKTLRGPMIGTSFRYNTGDSSLLSRKFSTYFKSPQEYWRFPREELFDKLGFSEEALINVDSSMVFAGGALGYFTPRDLLKFGIFLLNDGVVNSERLLPENWIKMSTTGSLESNGTHGYHFWIPSARYDKPPEIPKDCFAASGIRKQICFVCPSLELIVTRQGLTDVVWKENELFKKIIH
jgi:hypothetical protein